MPLLEYACPECGHVFDIGPRGAGVNYDGSGAVSFEKRNDMITLSVSGVS